MSKENKLIPELRFPEFVNQTEWAKKELDEIAFSESSSMALNKLDLKSSGYPVYGADSIVGYIDYFQQSEKYISIVKDGSGVGRLNLCQSHSSILGTLTRLISKDGELYELDWVYYLLNTIDFSIHVKGAGIPHIYFSDFKKENVPVPTLPEQQKIASCLSSLDEVIAAHSQKLELLKNHKKGLMQNLFPQEGEAVPKFRFKEFEKDGEWVEKKLDEVCEINPKVLQLPEQFVYIDLESVEKGILLQRKIMKSKGAPSRAQRLLKENDVIFQMVRPYQNNNFHFLGGDDLKYVASTGYAQLRAFHSSKYLYQFIHTSKFVANVLEKCTGSNYPAINSSDLSQIAIQLPSTPKEQQKIAECLSSVDALITAQTEKIEQLKLHKKGLMQGLFPLINH